MVTKEEKEVLRAAREYFDKLKTTLSSWDDLPPELDPSQYEDIDFVSSKKAKVGDVYLEKAKNIKVRTTARFTATKSVPLPNTGERTTREVEVAIPEGLEREIKEGYKVWCVIQPKWTTQDQQRIDAIHAKYAAMYKNNPEYKGLYEQPRVRRWPQDPFPNGRYSTERWVPKVFDAGKWRKASDHECKNWESIPEDRKRVDYLLGVFPEEE